MKEKITDILTKIQEIAKDTRTWIKVLVMIAVITGSFYIGAKSFSKTKKEDCTYYKEQNAQLVTALLNVKQMVSNKSAGVLNVVMLSSLPDTTPQQRRVSRYVDSVLREIKRQDSIFKTKKSKS